MEQYIEQQKRLLVMILSILGFLVSSYIYIVIEKENGTPAGCQIGSTGIINCHAVVGSQYGNVFGVPWSVIGAFYFLILFAIYFVDYYDDYLIALLVLAGLVSIVYFVFLELVVLDTICLYCTTVHIIEILIALLIGPQAIKNSYLKLNQELNLRRKSN